MSETVTIEPQYIGEYIEYLSTYLCGSKGVGKPFDKMRKGKVYYELKSKEMAEVNAWQDLVAWAISIGLLLAKRQPELADAQIHYLDSIKQAGFASGLLNDLLEGYKEFQYYKAFVDKERG